jgi:hypothetical protein
MCTCRYLSDDTDVCFLDMLIGGSQMAEAGDVGRPCSSRTWEMLLERSFSWPVAFSEVESLVAPWTRLTTWPSHQQYQKIRGDTDLYVRQDLKDRVSHLQALEKDACSRAKEGLGRMPRLKARSGCDGHRPSPKTTRVFAGCQMSTNPILGYRLQYSSFWSIISV